MMRNIDAKFKKPYNNCNLRKIIYHQYLPMFMSIFNLRGAQTDRFWYEVFQNLFFSPMNTGFLRDTVATVLTVYGIETKNSFSRCSRLFYLLQQYLPFTVLKPSNHPITSFVIGVLQQYLPFTVLKLWHFPSYSIVSAVRCNSTYRLRYWNLYGLLVIHAENYFMVATVLTVYGIETKIYIAIVYSHTTLQQYLPFTVLKLSSCCK